MKSISITLLAVSFAAIAAAQQTQIGTAPTPTATQEIRSWGDGPVRHLMTKDEMRQWKDVKSDAEAQAFIDLFWARRDPTPDTPRNEFKEDFEARVLFADKNFAGGKETGSLSDRGKVFILLGPPEHVSGRAGDQSVSSIRGAGTSAPVNSSGGILVPSAEREENRQIWTYAHDKKPKFVPQADFVIVFTDSGNNDWHMAHTERSNADGILLTAVNASIVNPNLKKAPVYAEPKPAHPTAFKSADLKTAFEQFRAGSSDSIGSAILTDAEFVSSEGVHFISAQMYAPSGTDISAGQKLTFLSVLEDKDGKVVDVREDPVTMIGSGTDSYVDKSIEIEPGTYTATFALADNGKILAARKTPVTVQGLDPNAVALTPLLLSSNVYPMKTTWHPTDPFVFGGLKVIPKGDQTFANNGDLWYFVELHNPGVTDAGIPNMRVRVQINGKTAKGPVELKIPMQDTQVTKLPQEKNRYALGVAIPLEGFVPGDYTMKIRVSDVVLGKDYDFEKAFKVRG